MKEQLSVSNCQLFSTMPLLQTRAGDSGEAPKQFNQPSRKGKKAWRKNIDVTEVEDGLVELNKEIIRGYGFISDSL